jgi:choice-of-anchor A domain-containing protein
MTPSLLCRRTRLGIDSLEGREVPAAALGAAADYGLFALHGVNLFNSTIEGRSAVGGNATITGYSIGDKLPDSNGTRDDLIVGGNLTFTNGQVANGNAVYGGTGTFTSFGIPNGTTRQQVGVINFAQAEASLDALSDQDAALPANGTVSYAYGNLTLTGTNPVQNVFDVTASQLWYASNLVIKAPAGSSVVVNVSGANDRMQSMGVTLQGVGKESVVLNFPQASQLTLNGVGVPGNILAPRAHVDFSNGNVQGTLVASSWTGSGVINYTPPTPPPPAGTSAISGLVYRDQNQDGQPQNW